MMPNQVETAVLEHNGMCDECASFDLSFGFEGYKCHKCGHEGEYTGGY